MVNLRALTANTVAIPALSAATIVPVIEFVDSQAVPDPDPTPDPKPDTQTVFSQIYEWHMQTIQPSLTKANIDGMITNSLIFSAYYSSVSVMGAGAHPSYMAKAAIAVGYKLFATFAEPAIAQFTESFTELHFEQGQYAYHAVGCLFAEDHCQAIKEAANPFFPQDSLQPHLWNDFSQFDFTAYSQSTSQKLDQLSWQGLMTTGILSASSSEIKGFIFETTGFENYCQGYWCKNWIGFYFKDFIKSVLKDNLVTKSTTTETTLEQPVPAVIALEDVLHDSPRTENNTCTPLSFTPQAPVIEPSPHFEVF